MEIAYVAIVVSDPATVNNAFECHLGLARTELKFRGERVPAFQVGRTKIVVLAQGSPALAGEAKTGVHAQGNLSSPQSHGGCCG